MSNKRLLIWTLAGVMTPDLGAALAQAAGCDDIKYLKKEAAAAKPGGKQELQQQLLLRLQNLAGQPVLVVHDVTAADLATNLQVAQAASELGYQHLFVYFRGEAKRMMLRMGARPALATLDVGTLMQRSRRSVEMLAALKHHAEQQGWPAFSLAMEDLQGAPDAGAPARQLQFLAWLDATRANAGLQQKFELARATLPDPRPEPDNKHMAKLWQELAWEPGVEARYVWLRPNVKTTAPAPSPVAMLRLAPLPPYVPSGREVGITGALRLQADTPQGWSLKLVVDDEDYVVEWDASGTDAASARFDSGVLPVRGGMAMRLALVSPQGTETTLATVDWTGPAHESVPGILLGEYSLGYFIVPKAACTSLKQALIQLATRQELDRVVQGTDVHRYFGARKRDITLADFKFLVVRDPVKRFLSAYSNRVVHHRELSRKFLEPQAGRWGLSLDDFVFDPELHTFLERFATYCKVGPILHHTRPVAHSIPSLDVFDKVYPLESMPALQADISKITGQEFVVGRSQTGGPKIGIDELSLAQIERLFELYRDDYALLKDFYTPEKLLAERAKLINQ